jgi:flagellar assembly protein FliH
MEIEAEPAESVAGATIIENARSEARGIIQTARESVKALITDETAKAHEEGFKQGYADGAKKAETLLFRPKTLMLKAKALVKKAERQIERTKKERDEALENAEKDVLNLIMNLTEKIVGFTEAVNPQIIMALIRSGLRESSDRATVRVSAEDYDVVLGGKDELVKSLGKPVDIEISKDMSLARSECVIQTPYGSVDCGLDTQINSLKNALSLIYGEGVGHDY